MSKIFNTLREFQTRFSFYHPIEMALLSCLGAVRGILEMLTVTALIPLTLLILNPDSVIKGKILGKLYHLSGLKNANHFAILLAGGLIFFFTIKLIIGILIWRYEFKVIQRWRLRILNKLFCTVVHAKYSKVQSEDSATLINVLSTSVPYVVTNLFYNMTIVANTFLTFVFLLSFSFLYSARTILITSLFGIVLIYSFIKLKKKRMRYLGERNQQLSKAAFSILQKSIFGLKEAKLSLKQTFFGEKFQNISSKQANVDLDLQFTQNLPSLVVEFISLVTILSVFIFLLAVSNDISQAATEIAVLIFVGIRLIPLMNMVISALTMMSSCDDPVRTILSYHDNLSADADFEANKSVLPLKFRESIVFNDVSFSYEKGAKLPALSNVSFHVSKGKHIGLVGPSGSGKSTIVNIILGFLTPDSGKMLVDGKTITTKYINNLRKILSFVDQTPFLMNDTYTNNIAYGEEENDINLDRVQNCLEKVGLWGHVLKSPRGLDFEIGENGKFLSGGQRQRLAIARALYKNAQVIILDEASSALDMDSEALISELLETLKGDLTIISIAHRLSTLKSCDEIFFVDNGRIQAQGNFQTLYKKSADFKRYIEHSNIKVDEDGAN